MYYEYISYYFWLFLHFIALDKQLVLFEQQILFPQTVILLVVHMYINITHHLWHHTIAVGMFLNNVMANPAW